MKAAATVFFTFCCAFAQQRTNCLDSLNEFSTSLENLVNRVNHSVVQIFSSGYALADEAQPGVATGTVMRQWAIGTGVILSADGYIVTNAHVVANARRVRVRVPAESPHGHSIAQAVWAYSRLTASPLEGLTSPLWDNAARRLRLNALTSSWNFLIL